MRPVLSARFPPGLPGAPDACAARLTDALAATEGVEHAHIVGGEDGRPAQLCLLAYRE